MPSPRTGAADVVRRDEKFGKLTAFLANELPGALDRAAGTPLNIDLVARSPESPVAQALMVALAEVGDEHVEIRALFAIEPEAAAFGGTLANVTVRCTPSSRFDDAHEQLSIGDQVAWIGDSMRRDPSKLDAYERFISGDLEPCGWNSHAFRQLWALSSAPRRARFHATFDVGACDQIGPALAALRDGRSKPNSDMN